MPCVGQMLSRMAPVIAKQDHPAMVVLSVLRRTSTGRKNAVRNPLTLSSVSAMPRAPEFKPYTLARYGPLHALRNAVPAAMATHIGIRVHKGTMASSFALCESMEPSGTWRASAWPSSRTKRQTP